MQVQLPHSFIMIIAAGVVFFLFGLQSVTTHLNSSFSHRIHALMQKISKSYLVSIGVGFVLAVISQSSGAITSMLVRLGSANVISLQEVMGVIVGSAIGSTMTVQLLSFRIADYGLALIVFSFLIRFFSKNRKFIQVMKALTGLGFIFLGMEFVRLGSTALTGIPIFTDAITSLNEQPYIHLIAGVLICSLAQSSTLAIGLAFAFFDAGLIPALGLFEWVIGANIGTTSIALIASIGANHIGKQVAWAHFLFKAGAVALPYLLLTQVLNFFASLGTTTIESAALFHLGINIWGAVLLAPFVKYGVRFMEFLIPNKKDQEPFGPLFLNRERGAYHTSTLSLAYAERELQRLAEIVISQVRDALPLFDDYDPEMIQSVKERDSMVDLLYREIKMYLAEELSNVDATTNMKAMRLILFADDLERAGDVVEQNILELARKKHELKLSFSHDGWEELKEAKTQLIRLCQLSVQHFFTGNLENDMRNVRREFRRLERALREKHVERLNQKMEKSIRTSSIHLDVISDLGRISSLFTRYRKY